MVFNATFNNILVISSQSVFWWRKPEKTTDRIQTVFEIRIYKIVMYVSLIHFNGVILSVQFVLWMFQNSPYGPLYHACVGICSNGNELISNVKHVSVLYILEQLFLHYLISFVYEYNTNSILINCKLYLIVSDIYYISLSGTCSRSVVFSRKLQFPPSIKLTVTI
jgi:hypothetical protein